MSLATLARTQAERAIERYGASVTYVRTTPGDYDPATGGGTDTPATYAVKGVWTDYAAGQVNGTSVLAQDRKVMLAASALEAAGLSGAPIPGRDTVDGLSVVRLERADQVMGQMIAYTVQVRR